MRLTTPAFGFISGLGATLGLLPHVLTLCFLLITGIPPRSVSSLVVFTIGAKLLGEWLFWNFCRTRMDSYQELKNWRKVIDQSLLSHPNVGVALCTLFVDGMVDATLVYTALATPILPIWVFLALFGCQAISSPIQGLLSDYFSQKKSLLFASLIGMIALILSLGLPLDGEMQDASQASLFNWVGLPSLTTTFPMALILCIKGLFGNLAVIARAAIAEVIKVETLEKFGRYR